MLLAGGSGKILQPETSGRFSHEDAEYEDLYMEDTADDFYWMKMLENRAESLPTMRTSRKICTKTFVAECDAKDEKTMRIFCMAIDKDGFVEMMF